jgi:hypothetical protein
LGMQIFAPADNSTYGGDQEPNEGYFFTFDGLAWSISAPARATIGLEGATREVFYSPQPNDFQIERNTWDTSLLDADFEPGTRIEFGRIEDGNGWFVSYFQLKAQKQFINVSGGSIVFDDPDIGPEGGLLVGNVNNNAITNYTPETFKNLPVTFNNVTIESEARTWNVEANYLHRFMTGHNGGTFEMFMGARYFDFQDRFNVSTATDPSQLALLSLQGSITNGTATTVNAGVPSFLGGSFWDTTAENHIVGPQIGLRWFKKRGRWTFSTEGRFMAGLNCQNVKQEADIGPQLSPGAKTMVVITVPEQDTTTGQITYRVKTAYIYTPYQPRTMTHASATYSESAREFAPMVELRLEGKYQLTRGLALRAGWTGMWMDGIARSSSLINYRVGTANGEIPMGIDMDRNRQSVFINGLTMGIEINR